ncbi:MAG: hypothetical protein QOI12_3670 [Alphaproteobacteria bacterium]|jgi:hypothetical protein|nr:hypothetical protein [Alphaproteobacteria bacterium]
MGQGRFTTPKALANFTLAQVRREELMRPMVTANVAMLTIERDAMDLEKGSRNSASWIDSGEKYAVIGLSVSLDDAVPFQRMTPHHWAFADARFDMPPHWREWLGTIRTKEVEGSSLFLLSKVQSQMPDILDGKNAGLKRRVGHFYSGLLLASPFAPAHSPVMLSGSRRDGAALTTLWSCRAREARGGP